MAKITLSETIAYRNPQEAIVLLEKHGYPKPINSAALSQAINHFIRNNGDEAIDELMAIHPDKDAITEWTIKQGGGHGHRGLSHHTKHHGHHHGGQHGGTHHNCCGSGGHHSADGFNNCAGCGGSCGAKSYNTDGGGQQKDMVSSISSHTFYAVLLVVTVFGLIMISSQDKRRAAHG